MFGDRLRLARKRSGFSLRDLAAAMGGTPSAQAIGKYERGEMMPRSRVLIRLAEALQAPPEFLLNEQHEKLVAVEFRKLSGVSARDRARIEAAVIDCVERHLFIEQALELDSIAWERPSVGGRFWEIGSDGEVLASDLRREWELGIYPISDMTALLEAKGIKVLLLPLPARVPGLTCLAHRPQHDFPVPVIVVNRQSPLEQRRLTLARELTFRLIDEESPVDHEITAEVFAGALLVPEAHLSREAGHHRRAIAYPEMVRLKHAYRVSAKTLLRRLAHIGVIEDSSMPAAFRKRVRDWRSLDPEPLEAPGQKGQLEAPRRFETLCFRGLSENLISLSKASELLQATSTAIDAAIDGTRQRRILRSLQLA